MAELNKRVPRSKHGMATLSALTGAAADMTDQSFVAYLPELLPTILLTLDRVVEDAALSPADIARGQAAFDQTAARMRDRIEAEGKRADAPSDAWRKS